MHLFVLALLAPPFAAVVAAVSWQSPAHHSPGNDGGTEIGARVDLGYAIYQGERLSAGVNQYLGMRFAAPPLGELRFRAPVNPVVNRTVQAATEHGPLCYGVGSGVSNTNGQSEDCLYIDVFAPSNATETSKLPVFFWIQGGGYVSDANADYNGTALVNASGGNMIVVTFNYRVGPFGFLASEKVRQDGDLNVGLLDQRQAMGWVQRHISKFGGDPNHIVLVGASAGAGSVAMHLIAYGGRHQSLFVGGIGESVFFPTQPYVSELEWQFDAFANASGCGHTDNPLACLRKQSSVTLQSANIAFPYPGHSTAPLFDYSPCIDGIFLIDLPYRLFEAGQFVDVPIIFGNDNNEGSYFAVNASTPQNISQFFVDNYPLLTTEDTAAINSEYPLSANPPVAAHAEYFDAASNAYGESTFICPGLLIVGSYTRHYPLSTWNYRFNLQDPANIAAGLGTPHTFEIPAVWGTQSNAGGSGTAYETTNAPDVPLVMDYWISFVRSLDPNTYKEAGSPVWEVFGRGERLLFNNSGVTAMENVPQGQMERCAFWKELSGIMEQ